jgi:hypothetical protein
MMNLWTVASVLFLSCRAARILSFDGLLWYSIHSGVHNVPITGHVQAILDLLSYRAALELP